MAKIKRKYYRRAKKVANLVINNVQYKNNVIPLSRNIPLVSNNNVENNNPLSYNKCNNSQNILNDYNDLENLINYNSDNDIIIFKIMIIII